MGHGECEQRRQTELRSVKLRKQRRKTGEVIVRVKANVKTRAIGVGLAMMLAGAALVAGTAVLAGAPTARAQDMRDGQALLTAMRDRYQGGWYDSVVFKQKSITLNADGTSSTEIWDEALVLPGKLRIDKEPHNDGNGYLFADGALTVFDKGKGNGPRPYVHMLLVLGFDVYRQASETTIKMVKDRGIDLAQIHEDTFEGEPMYVVGAAKGDEKSRQFWVEKKRLLFVRLIEPDAKDPTKIHDSRFRNYQKVGDGWLSERVEFWTDGKMTFREEYFDVKGNVKLAPELYDGSKFTETSIFN